MIILDCGAHAQSVIEKEKVRRARLIAIPELEAIRTLSNDDKYDRNRWLREIEAWEMVERNRREYVPTEPQEQHKQYSKSYKPYGYKD